MEENYLILLAFDKYDVPSYSKGEKQDDFSEALSYFLCSICPVKMLKPSLGFYASENELRNITSDWIVSPPELGFLFPTFSDRSANLCNAVYYTRNIAENHEEFLEAVFKSEISMPAATQKVTFQSILGDAVAEDCSIEVVQAVHEQLSEIIEEHKTNKEDPLVISIETVKGILKSCGVSESPYGPIWRKV